MKLFRFIFADLRAKSRWCYERDDWKGVADKLQYLER